MLTEKLFNYLLIIHLSFFDLCLYSVHSRSGSAQGSVLFPHNIIQWQYQMLNVNFPSVFLCSTLFCCGKNIKLTSIFLYISMHKLSVWGYRTLRNGNYGNSWCSSEIVTFSDQMAKDQVALAVCHHVSGFFPWGIGFSLSLCFRMQCFTRAPARQMGSTL